MADRTIDAHGLLVLPGGVDTHVHFNDVFMGTVSVHDYLTGTRAAAFGGTTSVIDFSNQVPGGSLAKTLRDKADEADGKALVDWGVHPVITRPDEETLAEIPAVVAAGAPTMKCYMTYREDGLLIEDADLVRIVKPLTEAGGMLMLHAEDNDSHRGQRPTVDCRRERRPPSTTPGASLRRWRPRPFAGSSRWPGRREDGSSSFTWPAHGGLELLTKAMDEGLDIRPETCAHYLIFSEEVLKRDDGIKWICSPPLRNSEAMELLWRGVADGRISMVTSDDAAYSWEAKLFGKDRFDLCPNGIPGIEPRFQLLYSEGVAKGRISLPRFVEIVASEPARLFGYGSQEREGWSQGPTRILY